MGVFGDQRGVRGLGKPLGSSCGSVLGGVVALEGGPKEVLGGWDSLWGPMWGSPGGRCWWLWGWGSLAVGQMETPPPYSKKM